MNIRRPRPRLVHILMALLPVACGQLILTDDKADRTSMDTGSLTSDEADAFIFDETGRDSVTVKAPASNAHGNLRMLFWRADNADVLDGQSCATWTSAAGIKVQQGAALRITEDDGTVRALTVTKNIFAAAQWSFNLHTWDSSATPPNRTFAQVPLKTVFLNVFGARELPWHFCARTIRGFLEFKAWLDYEPEPLWGEVTHGGKAEIPPGWEAPGKVGWYIGHIPPGGDAVFDDLRTWRIDDARIATPTG